ncbi:MAG: hypothetical protein AB7O21_00415 [Gammaproteobacteria bacterium]
MSVFEDILTADTAALLKALYKAASTREETVTGRRSRMIAKNLGLTHCQLLCAVGFNSHIHELPDVTTLLGYPGYDALAKTRNEYFVNDMYDRLGIRDVLAIYQHVARDPRHLQVLQYLMSARLRRLEERIEATVNSLVIERYKKEIRAIYADGVAQIEFADERLQNTHSGFRALLNEVTLMVESRLIPVGNMFFRENILPEEKRRLIVKGLVPRHLVESRLEEADIPPKERKVLEEQLRLMQ